jgi:hypothetical protein
MPIATIAIDLMIALLNNSAAISALIKSAQAGNRDLTVAELQNVIDSDSVARANLVLAIAAAKAAGR